MTARPADKALALVELAMRFVRGLVPALAGLPLVPLACVVVASFR